VSSRNQQPQEWPQTMQCNSVESIRLLHPCKRDEWFTSVERIRPFRRAEGQERHQSPAARCEGWPAQTGVISAIGRRPAGMCAATVSRNVVGPSPNAGTGAWWTTA
jgi:hypothetical protein